MLRRVHLAALVVLAASSFAAGCAPVEAEDDSSAAAASEADAASAERVLAHVVDHPDAVGVAGELATVKGDKGSYRVYAVPASVVRSVLSSGAASSVDAVSSTMDSEVGGYLIAGDSGLVAYYSAESGAVSALGREEQLRGSCEDFAGATPARDGVATKSVGLRPLGLTTPIVEAVVPLVQRAMRALFASTPKASARELPAATHAVGGAAEDASSAVRQSVQKLTDAGEKQAAMASRRPAKVVGEVSALPALTDEGMTALRTTVDGTIAVDRAAAKQLLSGGYKVYAGNVAHGDAAIVASRLAGEQGGMWLSVGTGWLQDVSVPTRVLPNFKQVQIVSSDDALREVADFAKASPGARWTTDMVVTPTSSGPAWLAQEMCDEFLVSIDSVGPRAIELIGGKWSSYRIYEAVHHARWRLRYRGGAPKITIVRDRGTPEARVEAVIRDILNDRVFSPPITRDQLSITILER